jgi:hypothetical protein
MNRMWSARSWFIVDSYWSAGVRDAGWHSRCVQVTGLDVSRVCKFLDKFRCTGSKYKYKFTVKSKLEFRPSAPSACTTNKMFSRLLVDVLVHNSTEYQVYESNMKSCTYLTSIDRKKCRKQLWAVAAAVRNGSPLLQLCTHSCRSTAPLYVLWCTAPVHLSVQIVDTSKNPKAWIYRILFSFREPRAAVEYLAMVPCYI